MTNDDALGAPVPVMEFKISDPDLAKSIERVADAGGEVQRVAAAYLDAWAAGFGLAARADLQPIAPEDFAPRFEPEPGPEPQPEPVEDPL